MSGKRRGKVDKPFNARGGLPANYGNATPEEVALAVLRYRPGKKKQRREEKARDEASRSERESGGSRR